MASANVVIRRAGPRDLELEYGEAGKRESVTVSVSQDGALVLQAAKAGGDHSAASKAVGVSGNKALASCSAIAGVMQFSATQYVVGVSGSAVGSGPGGAVVQRVMSWHFVPIDAAASTEKDARCRALFDEIADTDSFYFSTSLDLTRPLQEVLPAGPAAGPAWTSCDQDFAWNAHMMAPLRAGGADAALGAVVCPVVNGLVEVHEGCVVGDKTFSLFFVSRRSRHRQGTRFTRRGVDSAGHAANVVQTEQACLWRDGTVTSFVQLRGSIPVHWAQPCTLKYTPKVKFLGESSEAFRAHVVPVLDRWGAAVAVNLIDKKKDQLALGAAFERECVRLDDARLRYVWFDFHHECRKMQWHNLGKLLDDVRADVDAHGFFHLRADGSVARRQTGIVRTNCMDNLDRTNVVQSLFARHSILSQLGALKPGMDPLNSPFPAFELVFKNLWANNADAMSFLYSGTGALKTDFTRTGKRTVAGALQDGVNSVKRYVLNNLSDGARQDAFDVFLGVPGAAAAVGPAGMPASTRLVRDLGFLLVGVAAVVAVSLGSSYTMVQRAVAGVFAAQGVFLALGHFVVKKGASFAHGYVDRPSLVKDDPTKKSTKRTVVKQE